VALLEKSVKLKAGGMTFQCMSEDTELEEQRARRAKSGGICSCCTLLS